MKTQAWIPLTVVLLLLAECSSKPQQVVTANNGNASNPAIPSDPFLDEEEFEKDYPSVVSLKYHLKEDTLTEFFSKLALQDLECPLPECNVSLVDIVEATQIRRFSTEDIADAIGKLNINPIDAYNILLLYDVKVSTIEYLLQTFGITFFDIYNNFIKSLANPSTTIPDILNILNVSVFDFMNAQAYGNDTVRLQVLSTGNYSQSNIIRILNITQKSPLDMLKLLPLNVTAAQIGNIDAQDFGNFVKNLGVTSYDLRNFYQHLNITAINFLTYPPFIRIVTGVYDLLNVEEVLGVIISKTKVLTSNKARVLATYQNQNSELIRSYAKFYVELVENPLIQHIVKNITFVNPEYQSGDIAIVESATPFTVNGSEVSKNYTASTLLNCTYVSRLPFGGIYSENVPQVALRNNTLAVAKSLETIYNLGSPLFCQDKLYGIAVQDGARNITFSTLQKSIPTTTARPGVGPVTGPTTGTHPGQNGGSVLSSSILYLVIAILAVYFQ